MSKFRKGDRVTIDAVVLNEGFQSEDGGHRLQVSVEPYHEIYVSASSLTMKRPEIAVGDTVRCRDVGTMCATVLAVAEDHAWVSFGDGNYSTWWLSKVERVDPDDLMAEDRRRPRSAEHGKQEAA